MKTSYGFGSQCIKMDKKPTYKTPAHQLPIYASSSFVFEHLQQGIDVFQGKETGYLYSRFGNPTIDSTSQKIADLEGFELGIHPEAIMVASGMAAIHILLSGTLQPGQKILTQPDLYGGTTELIDKIFKPLNILPIYQDLRKLDEVEQTLKSDPSIGLIYMETPANPTMTCIDLNAIAQLAEKYQIWTAVDNTFCTPFIQQPFQHGIDFIIHSTTKFLNGHGNSIAGVIIGKDSDVMQKKIWPVMKLTGGSCNSFDAWLTYQGIKTLELRMERQTANALALATFLEKHPKINFVNYPGLVSHPDHSIVKKQMKSGGAMLSFEVQGGLPGAENCINHLQLATLAPTLGDIDTLVMHPFTMSHGNIDPRIKEQQRITEGLVRVSVGAETASDIIQDFEQSLQYC
ncbi:MAG: trans-sulfuration enzyme family protein [Saprospiraceae bacterium]